MNTPSPLTTLLTLLGQLIASSLALINLILMLLLPVMAAVVILGWIPTLFVAFFLS